MKHLLIEAFIVGVILLIISIPVMGITHTLYPDDYTGCLNLPLTPSGKTKYYVSTIIIGIMTHLLCEVTGINKMYCISGHACKQS